MSWLMLAGAITAEVIATVSLKLSAGMSRPGPMVVVVIGYIVSFVLLAQALRLRMQVSVAYAVWSGVGTAAIAVIGALLLDERLTVTKAAGIVLVIAGVVVLNLSGAR